MNISQNGLNLIKEFEGCRLTAYKDAVGIWTVGYGCTSADRDITGTNIYQGMTITQAQADEWLYKSVSNKYVPKVMKYDAIYHWNQNQLDALTSFAYNIGSIDQLVNYGQRSIAEISTKILAYNKAGGKVLAGLTRRRNAEKELFDTPIQHLNGWVQDKNGWCYYVDGEYYKSGWEFIDGKYYYFKSNGYMAHDEYIKSDNYDDNKKLYYVSENGAWNNHSYWWKSNDVGWWLEGETGWYAHSEWLYVDDKWYYAKSNGYIATGMIMIDNKIYHFRDDGTLIE